MVVCYHCATECATECATDSKRPQNPCVFEKQWIPPASMSRQVIHLTTLFFACVTNCRIARLYFDVRFLVVLPSCWRFWWIRFSNYAVHCLMTRSGNADAMNDLCAKTCETCVTHLRLDPWRLCSKRSSWALCARSQF